MSSQDAYDLIIQTGVINLEMVIFAIIMISKNNHYFWGYAIEILKVKLREKMGITMSSKDAYRLTHRTGISNLELETIISQDCSCSWFYAFYVLEGRFELGEKMISQDGCYSWGVCYGCFARSV